MKRFSTVRRVMPHSAAARPARVTTSRVTRWRSVKPAKVSVTRRVRSRPWRGWPGASRPSRLGNTRKQVTRATPRPRVIIQPKSITGRMSLITRDEKPTMVVRIM